MKEYKQIHTELKNYCNHLFDNPNSYKEITAVEGFIKTYVLTNQKEFEYDFYDELDEMELSTLFQIEDLLSYKRYFIAKSLLCFMEEESEKHFKNILKNTYLYFLSFIIRYLKHKKNIIEKQEFCLLYLLAISFFPVEERKLYLKAFNHIISDELIIITSKYEKDGSNLPPQLVEKLNQEKNIFESSILPLAFFLSIDYIDNNDDNLNQNIGKLNFNELYKDTYENYLSDDKHLISSLFNKLCNYHLSNIENNFYSNRPLALKFFPLDIITLVRLRAINNLSIDNINHPLIDKFIPYLKQPIDFMDDELLNIRNKIFNELINTNK